MFDLKENKTELDSKTMELSSSENIKSTVIHTMKDDLDALQGITVPEKKVENVSSISDKKTDFQAGKYIDPSQSSKDPKKSYSPFLNAGPSENKDLSITGKPQKQSAELSPQKSFKWKKVFIVSIIVVVVLSLSAGGYYFWITRNQPIIETHTTPPENIPENNTAPVTPPVNIEPVQPKFSLEKPNYLSIDTETANAQSLKQLLTQTASEVKDMNVTTPVEFVITDSNNNPIAFPIFSVISELKLSPVIENLDETFSLFVAPDISEAGTESSNMRIALAINIKNKPAAISTMKTKENTLISDLSFLFLDIPSQKTGKFFNDNNFNGHVIRYANVDESGQGKLSIDYSFTENQLILATSKNTMWMLLDKLK
jgi:hypothetical protein